jgi:hypothetical protein
VSDNHRKAALEKPRGPYTRRKDPAEVSAVRKAVVNKLFEYEGEMIPLIEKLRRVNGRNSYKLPLLIRAGADLLQAILPCWIA